MSAIQLLEGVMGDAARTGRFKCAECLRDITSSRGAYLVLSVPGSDGLINHYPFLAHGDCFEQGIHDYLIELWEIRLWGDGGNPHRIDDSFKKWDAHLRMKRWWDSRIGGWLVIAHTCAKTLPGGQDEIDRKLKRNASARYIPPSIRARVLERDKFTCQRCGGRAPDVKLHVDHVTPVARGGRPSIDNLQTLCETCNNGKGDKEPTEHDLRRPTA